MSKIRMSKWDLECKMRHSVPIQISKEDFEFKYRYRISNVKMRYLVITVCISNTEIIFQKKKIDIQPNVKIGFRMSKFDIQPHFEWQNRTTNVKMAYSAVVWMSK